MFAPAINARGERILGDSKNCKLKSGRCLGLACLIIWCVSYQSCFCCGDLIWAAV